MKDVKTMIQPSIPQKFPKGLWGAIKRNNKKEPVILFNKKRLKSTSYLKFLNILRKMYYLLEDKEEPYLRLYSHVMKGYLGDKYMYYVSLAEADGVLSLHLECMPGKSRVYKLDIDSLHRAYVYLSDVDPLAPEIQKFLKKEESKEWRKAYKKLHKWGMDSSQITYMKNMNIRAVNMYNQLFPKSLPIEPWIKVGDDHKRVYTAAGNIPSDLRHQCLVDSTGEPLVEFDLKYANTTLLAMHLGLEKLLALLKDDSKDFYTLVGLQAIENKKYHRIIELYELDVEEDREEGGGPALCRKLEDNTHSTSETKGDYEITKLSPDHTFTRPLGKHITNAGLNTIHNQDKVNRKMRVVLDTIAEHCGEQEAETLREWCLELDRKRGSAFRKLTEYEWEYIQVSLSKTLATSGVHVFPIHDAIYAEKDSVSKVLEVLQQLGTAKCSHMSCSAENIEKLTEGSLRLPKLQDDLGPMEDFRIDSRPLLVAARGYIEELAEVQIEQWRTCLTTETQELSYA